MTPSNPDNQQPLIYRICDAAGVFHIIAPVNHTHTQAEIEGLTAALAGKANAIPSGSPSGGIVIANTAGELLRSPKTILDLENAIAAKQDALTFDTTPTEGSTNPVTSGGVKTALDGKANINHTHTFIGQETSAESASVSVSGGAVNIEVRNEGGGGECDITPSNIGNLYRALSDPDTVPTLNSNKLVTSNGVRVALEERFQGIVPDVITLGEGDSMRLDELGMTPPSVRRFIIENNSSYSVPFRDMFVSDSLPVHISGDETLEVGSHEYVMVSIFRENSSEHVHFNCYFVLFEGIFSE